MLFLCILFGFAAFGLGLVVARLLFGKRCPICRFDWQMLEPAPRETKPHDPCTSDIAFLDEMQQGPPTKPKRKRSKRKEK